MAALVADNVLNLHGSCNIIRLLCNNVSNLHGSCIHLFSTSRTVDTRSCIKPFMSEIEQNNRYGHHTARLWLVSAYMHIKCTVGRMMANPNDLYSVDELDDAGKPGGGLYIESCGSQSGCPSFDPTAHRS